MACRDLCDRKYPEKAQLESDVKTLTSQVQINQQMAADLRQVKALPEGVTLRAYRPEALQQNIKSMLDQVMRLASNRGNDLIALEPWDAPLVEPRRRRIRRLPSPPRRRPPLLRQLKPVKLRFLPPPRN